MKKLALLALALLACGCAARGVGSPLAAARTDTSVAAHSRIDVHPDISDLKEISSLVPFEAKRVLYVFDIDDTLLTSQGDFGGDSWFGWQFDKKNQNPVPCPLDVVAITTEEKALELTQPDAPAIFNSIFEDKILLTSRNAGTARSATVRELTRVSDSRKTPFYLPAPLENASSGLLFRLEKNQLASYFDGIYMVTGQNKGTALVYLLKNVLGILDNYETIVLIDDGMSNIEKMSAAMAAAGKDFYGLHYTRIKKAEATPDQIKAWDESWSLFIDNLKAVSAARAESFLQMPPACDYR